MSIGRTAVTLVNGIADFGNTIGLDLALIGPSGGPYTLLFNTTVTYADGTRGKIGVETTVQLRLCSPGEGI
jgi:hypothetical protein